VIDVQALTALSTKPCFMLLTDGKRFPIWMVFAVHLSRPISGIIAKKTTSKERDDIFPFQLTWMAKAQTTRQSMVTS